jgi:hypothetical protein
MQTRPRPLTRRRVFVTRFRIGHRHRHLANAYGMCHSSRSKRNRRPGEESYS